MLNRKVNVYFNSQQTRERLSPTSSQSVIGPPATTVVSETSTDKQTDGLGFPTKEGFSFMPNFPSRQLVETQAPPVPPPPAPQPSPPNSRSCSSPTLWYYRDPSGNERGPFDDATMGAWFTAGYFPVSNEVRRKCDKVFLRISEFLLFIGRTNYL